MLFNFLLISVNLVIFTDCRLLYKLYRMCCVQYCTYLPTTVINSQMYTALRHQGIIECLEFKIPLVCLILKYFIWFLFEKLIYVRFKFVEQFHHLPCKTICDVIILDKLFNEQIKKYLILCNIW